MCFGEYKNLFGYGNMVKLINGCFCFLSMVSWLSEFQNNHFGEGGDDPLGLFESQIKKRVLKKVFKCQDCLEKFDLELKEEKKCLNCGSESVIEWDL
jgi:DNA-directed RNA polymerase subunit RPC12/RpoP